MKKNQDLLAVLRSNNMRITHLRRVLLQFILDNKSRQISLKEIHDHVEAAADEADRSSVYRNLEAFKDLEIIQELNLPNLGKRFEYIWERDVRHYYICKRCGRANKGNQELFDKIGAALRDIHGFVKSNLSVVFYGTCSSCDRSPRS